MEEEKLHYGSVTKTARLSRQTGTQTRSSSPEAATTGRLPELQTAQAIAPRLPQLWDVSRSSGDSGCQSAALILKQAAHFRGRLFLLYEESMV